MTYISFCSGIEAATAAWHPRGWSPVAFCEIDKFASRVLAHHYPEVPNLGDFTKVDWSQYSADIPGAADGPRYKALGNSMARPVMPWIGRRIQEAYANH